MRAIFLTVLVLGSAIGCAARPESSARQGEDAFAIAMADGDYRRAINLMMPKASDGDPEYEFAVGRLLLEWIEDPQAKELPEHSAKEALAWIYRAEKAGVPQASGTLREGYERGRFSLSKNTVLEECWRKVENDEQTPDVCLAAEALILGRQPSEEVR